MHYDDVAIHGANVTAGSHERYNSDSKDFRPARSGMSLQEILNASGVGVASGR
jgi:hypothetical protein